MHAVAERMEAELGEEKVFSIEGCERDWKQLPQPALPLTVELDGGFVHSSEQTSRTDGWFEVITGKSMTATGTAKCFAFVNTYDETETPAIRVAEISTYDDESAGNVSFRWGARMCGKYNSI